MTIRFGLVGTGRITDWVLKGALQDPRFRAAALCSRSEESARRFIAAHPQAFPGPVRIFTSPEEMAAFDGIDAVYIGTPNVTHHPLTLTFLRAGKHVLCEKPLACSLKEAEEMVEASRSSGKALMEAMISTLNPNFIAARARIPELGRIHQVFAVFCQYSTKYDALLNGEVSNSFNPGMGGGALEDLGVYTAFPVVALFGLPGKVMSCRRSVPSACGDVEVEGSALLEYPGMIAHLTWSKACDARQCTEICGEKGNIIIDSLHNAHRSEFIPHAVPSGGRGPLAEKILLSEGLQMDDYYYEFREFIDVVARAGIESGVNSHRVSLDNRALMDMIKESWNGQNEK